MENKKELLEKIVEITKKKTSLEKLCAKLELSEIELLGLIGELKLDGTNILTKRKYDDIYLFNSGDSNYDDEFGLQLKADKNGEFKFIAFSDTRFGSKYQQLSIVNDIYKKGYAMGYKNAFICGNITEGLYDITDPYANSIFLDDTIQQSDYIIKNFPKIEGMHTYFITGKQDKSHVKKARVDIGNLVSKEREDLTYLGSYKSNIKVEQIKVRLFNNRKLEKTYTVSYRPQNTIKAYRSEDKPDILLYGGLLQMDKFSYRDIICFSVPSVVATTDKMEQDRQDNTVGAWYITIKVDEKGYLDKVSAIASPYYITDKKDYEVSKKLVLKKEVK